jgi:5-methylcytosine-specific restriction endonuclease McrA
MPTMPGTFRPSHMPAKADHERETDRARGTAHERGYNNLWSRASRSFLDANVLCPACAAAGITCTSAVTDHIQPHRGDRALFWNRNNWQACCRWHHNVVKQRLEALWDAGSIGVADLVLTSAYALRLAARRRLEFNSNRQDGGGGG